MKYLDTPHGTTVPCSMVKRRAESREGMITLTVALPPDLHRKLAIQALDDHCSMNEMIRDAVREHLQRKARPKKRRDKR